MTKTVATASFDENVRAGLQVARYPPLAEYNGHCVTNSETLVI